MPPVRYELVKQDQATGARLGRIHTPHGSFDTPAFMPVGTQATVKGMLPSQVADQGAGCILGNTYHLLLRPGPERVAEMGGLHPWMRWGGPILTDSGGFQVFSLAGANRMGEDGVTFKSHLDGSLIELTPERSMQVQHALGSDIMMAFDDCPPARAASDHQVARAKAYGDDPPDPQVDGDDQAYRQRVIEANTRTTRWLDRCIAEHRRSGKDAAQALFGIVQGGTDLELRSAHAAELAQRDLPGYAIGGVAVGEGPDEIRRVVEHTAPLLPEDRPRYLMGVGYERDIYRAVRAGVDMFDCVLPTRNARNAYAFTPTGPVRLKNAVHANDPGPIDPTCDCPACAPGSGPGGGPFSRSYLRHLFMAGEMLGPILVSLHNTRHFQRLMVDIRAGIQHNAWSRVERDWPVVNPESTPG